MKEHQIGEIFEYNGDWYQCIKGNTCNDCAFYRSSCGSPHAVVLMVKGVVDIILERMLLMLFSRNSKRLKSLI